jgi:hypothetical protein
VRPSFHNVAHEATGEKMKHETLGFGCHSSTIPDAPALWGARAIYTGRRVDLLVDRQDLVGESDAAKAALRATLNGGALRQFIKWANDRFDGYSREIESMEFDGITFVASTNGSHGYLYVTAYNTAEAVQAPAA